MHVIKASKSLTEEDVDLEDAELGCNHRHTAHLLGNAWLMISI